jgi:hypothetical protein
LLFVINQATTLFRSQGLVSLDRQELSTRFLEISGNEGAEAEMDGIEYFRTELVARGVAPNPMLGFLNGLLFRPIDGTLMIVPRSVFPWKPEDRSSTEYNLYFMSARMGVETDEATLGASAGLVGREFVRYGVLGPLTMLFWMGLTLALAEKIYSRDPASDIHRIFAASLIAFFLAQSRDFMPIWFVPFLPVMVIMAVVVFGARGRPSSGMPMPTLAGKRQATAGRF